MEEGAKGLAVICICDVRHPAEIAALKEKLPHVVTVRVQVRVP